MMSEALSAFLDSPLATETANTLLAQARCVLEPLGWAVPSEPSSAVAPGSWPTRTWTTRLLAPGGPDDLWLDVQASFHPSKAGIGLSQQWAVMVRWDTHRLLAGVTAINTAYHVLLGDTPAQQRQLAAALEAETSRNEGWARSAADAFAGLLVSRLQP